MRHVPVAIALAIACGGCGRGRDQPAGGSSSAGSDGGARVVTSSWPASPGPALPPELGELRWPMTAKQVTAKWPALAANDGLQVADLRLKVQPSIDPIDAQIWIDKPGVDLRGLERAWGQLARDHLGHAVWFDPKTGVKARYPAHDVVKREGVEISHYLPLLDRIAAAPDGMVPGARALLGQPAGALDSYQPWIVDRDDQAAQLWLPAGEWDPSHVTVGIGIEKGRIVRMTISTWVDAPPVDEAAIRGRLTQRWGEPREVADGGVWLRDGVTVELHKPTRQPAITLIYSTK